MGKIALVKEDYGNHPRLARIYGFAGDAGTGTVGNGVRMTGVRAEEDKLRAKPVLGQRSNRAVRFTKTIEPLTVPRESRSVLLAPAPLLMNL